MEHRKHNWYSFYSYKGGSGRTTTLLNTAKYLAQLLNASADHPLVLVDADLESAGLTYFFNCEKKFTAKLGEGINAEKLLTSPRQMLEGCSGNELFGTNSETLVSCDHLALRIDELYAGYVSVKSRKHLFEGLKIRTSTITKLEKIVEANERCRAGLADSDDEYLQSRYELSALLNLLEKAEEEHHAAPGSSVALQNKKRRIIEEFLPTDKMVDVSAYFGCEPNSVRFIGVDVAFSGKHEIIEPKAARRNKSYIASVFESRNVCAVLFDCGAGVQGNSHVLNHLSDVLVYCMRPTHQFISGTQMQLHNYKEVLQSITDKLNYSFDEEDAPLDEAESAHSKKANDKKAVILLPTAVPYTTPGTQSFQENSFGRIGRIANGFRSCVDSTFCSYETALKEVSLFKWREHILGTKLIAKDVSDEMIKAIEPYSGAEENMPQDAKEACQTYRLLAERLCYNSSIKELT